MIVEMISFGGGVNSVAMTILLVNEGWRGAIVFADTGAEWPETYCYMDYFEDVWLKPRNLTIIRLKPPSEYHRKGTTQGSLEEYSLEAGFLPLAFLRWCTQRFKVEPIEAWRKEQGIEVVMVAISAEEAHRAKAYDYHSYPLIERAIDRDGCKEIIASEGLDTPSKSSCFFCPFQTRYRWRDLWQFHPELFERASEMERNVSRVRDKKATLDPDGKYSLDDMWLKFEGQIELPGFEYEYLREFQGCVWSLKRVR